MSTISRRKRTSRLELGPYKRHELLTGKIIYPAKNYTGYADGTSTDLAAFASDEMRHDWRSNRDELLLFWASKGRAIQYADARPWLQISSFSFEGLPWGSLQFDDVEATRRELLAQRIHA